MRVTKLIFDEMHKNKRNFKDFVVLYRTNAQSRNIEDSLRHNGIPYMIVGGIRFYQRKEIKDILAYFKVIVNPLDNEAMIRILNMKEGVGKKHQHRKGAIAMIAEREGKQIFEAMKGLETIKSSAVRSGTALSPL